MKHKLVEPLHYNGKRYEPGEEVDLSESDVQDLLAAGIIEGGANLQTIGVKADGGKTIAPDEGTEIPVLKDGVVDINPREAELQSIFESQGWRAIARIAEPLGISKPDEGWDKAIALIVAKEVEIEKS